MNTNVADIVARAVGLALELSWFPEYGEWARAWLDDSDRSARSARKARMRVQQWIDFGGACWAAKCCSNAAEAAEFWARGGTDPSWLWSEALSFAEAAIRHAAYASNPPAERDAPYQEPELVVGDSEFSPGRVILGPGFRPRVRERED